MMTLRWTTPLPQVHYQRITERCVWVLWKLRLLALLMVAVQLQRTAATNSGAPDYDYFSLTARDIDGDEVSFSQFKGVVTLVVNTASMCGFTESHLRDLTRLHHILANTGHFQVLAFPCNQFGEQEPGDPAQIKQYVLVNYESEFMLMDKVDVIGEHAHPVFKYVAAESSVAPDWNFYKYLVDHRGRVLGVWGPRIPVSDIFSQVQAAVTAAEQVTTSEDNSTQSGATEGEVTEHNTVTERAAAPEAPAPATKEEL